MDIINILKGLGNIPIVTISLGVFLGYLLTEKQKKTHDKQITKQVLSFINIEINENLDRIDSPFPYTELSLKGFELISIQGIGNIKIDNTQLAIIIMLYTLFDEVNKTILSVRQEFYYRRIITTPHEKLEELRKRCGNIITEYLEG